MEPTPQFIREVMAAGVLSYREQQTLWQIAKRCAATTGITAAAPLALLGTQIGSIAIPGFGTITGPVMGALAGMIYGTVSCSMLNLSAQAELRKLAQGL
ncbi:hypothetical protein GO730_28255 [Spirosoma sp. HMF3257]|uniref:Uncharacterized protein n=1 Tax=Spirosoma telluris TaxID=2183553 RepID=A0A327NW83_9BACT|nr:hypothetical protein [Spirosoma telluris]RAI77098.1 hypothetical protein HMF3257_28200 [Spirosoma telluris]